MGVGQTFLHNGKGLSQLDRSHVSSLFDSSYIALQQYKGVELILSNEITKVKLLNIQWEGLAVGGRK